MAAPAISQNAPPVEVIRASLADYVGSIGSISVEYEQGFPEPDPSVPGEQRWIGQRQYKWIEQKPCHYLWGGPLPVRNAPQEEQIIAFDGTTEYAYRFYSKGFQGPSQLGLSRDPQFINGLEVIPSAFYGGAPTNFVKTLAAMLADAEGAVPQWDEVQGVRCLRVELGDTPVVAGIIRHVTAWFDPEHQFLPKRILVVANDPAPGERKKYRNDWVIQGFQLVPDAASATRQRWFPESASLLVERQGRVAEVRRAVFRRVVINEPIPQSTFRVDPAPGTMVYDRTDTTRPEPRQYVHGDHRTINEVIAEQVARARELEPPEHPAGGAEVLAAPAGALVNSATWLLLGLAAALLTAAAVCRWRAN